MSKQDTVEVPIVWLEGLLLEANLALKFHDGTLQQPKDHEAARLLGYIGSIQYLLPEEKSNE